MIKGSGNSAQSTGNIEKTSRWLSTNQHWESFSVMQWIIISKKNLAGLFLISYTTSIHIYWQKKLISSYCCTNRMWKGCVKRYQPHSPQKYICSDIKTGLSCCNWDMAQIFLNVCEREPKNRIKHDLSIFEDSWTNSALTSENRKEGVPVWNVELMWCFHVKPELEKAGACFSYPREPCVKSYLIFLITTKISSVTNNRSTTSGNG